MGTKQYASSLAAWTFLLAAWVVGSATSETMAQGSCDVEIEVVGNWNEFVPGKDEFGYSDVWGDGDVAYVGTWNAKFVFFIDISDPANPVEINTWSVPPPNDFASAQDIKVHDGLLFIALEGNGFDGVEIVDVRDPFNPAHLSWINTPGYSNVHNVFYEDGYLYLANTTIPAWGSSI